MKFDAFVLSDFIKIHEVQFYLYPKPWSEFNYNKVDLKNAGWQEVKFLDPTGTELSDEMKSLPENCGGIYLFIIKSDVLPTISEYLVYIGRAKHTATHNLKIRTNKYYYEFYGPNGRPKITRMVGKWGPCLYVKYLTLTDNNVIEELEAELINSLLPPFNDEIPEKKFRDAINAF